MIEILVIIAVVKAFGKKAEEKNLNSSTWKWIGGLSYYVPILLMSFIVLPFLAEQGIIQVYSESEAIFMSLMINLVTGILCCVAAYSFLSSLPVNVEPTSSDLLDDDF